MLLKPKMDPSMYMVYPAYMPGHSHNGRSHTLWGLPMCENIAYTFQTNPALGPGPHRVHFFFFKCVIHTYIYIYIVIMYFIYVIGPSSKTLGVFFSLISLISLTQLATIQLKNLTKTIKTFTIVIVF